MAVDQTAAILADAGRAFDRENDVILARAAIPGSLKTMEGFLEAHPEQPDLLRMLAEGYMNYAFGFLEDEAETLRDPDEAHAVRARAANLYLRARSFALRLLALSHPALAETLAAGLLPDGGALQALGQDDMPGLFWTANAWGAYINLKKSDVRVLAELPIVAALMERAALLDESFFFGGPHLTLGALAAALPVALGGDPRTARAHFERAVALTAGEHLMTKVLYARSVGVQTGDRDFFETTLRQVADADPDVNPNFSLANRLAQRRARRSLAEVDDLFL
jgi:predicted anti-sigma-YlaC factor YlaD